MISDNTKKKFLNWIKAKGKHSFTEAQTEQWMNKQRKIRREKNKIARKCRKRNRGK